MYVSIKEQDNKFEHSFGGKMRMKLGVDLKCCSKNTDTCKVCYKKLLGDYWHLKNKIFLCKLCMNKEYGEQTKYKRKELKQFRVRFLYMSIHVKTHKEVFISIFIYFRKYEIVQVYINMKIQLQKYG